MKKLFILFLLLLTCSCKTNTSTSLSSSIDYSINMDTNFEINDCLNDGNNQKAKVIVLLGQSNASGCTYNNYLEINTSKEEYERYQNGFDNVLINYSIDNRSYTTNGEFKKVDLTCGVKEGRFGPELGMSDVLSKEFKDETIFILKFTMSGYSLNHHWLNNYERFDIYNACLIFLETYLDYLISKNYDINLDAICFMQGESDTTEYKASRYYNNLIKFTNYLRSDLDKYNDDEIYFIDAGISDSPYCLPSYPDINKAKEDFSKLSPYNIYFPTIENGLTTMNEPYENPDLGHYDSLSMIRLGELFGEHLVSIYK
jgi:hypothetical protein